MLTDLRLQNFRSYTEESLEIGEGVNIIVGPNASGKTNLLESEIVLAKLKLFKITQKIFKKFKKPWARLDANTLHGHRTIKIIGQENKYTKELIIDKEVIKKPKFNNLLPVVLFEPNHLQLLSGSPENRREYMDDLLEQFTPGFDNLRKQYKRALQQRNFLLKTNNFTKDQLFVWNLRLSDLGGQIAIARQKLINRFNDDLTNIYCSMGPQGSQVDVKYISTCVGQQYSTSMLGKLESNQHIDERRGFTGFGPHRDDFAISLNGHSADTSASRGEVRTLLLAFKVVELKLLEEDRGVKPLLLMDDVFSELDGLRRKALTDTIKGYQTFITTTDADVVVQHFTETCRKIPTKG